jgi:wyosine [tRNA(Phe)-imidazoG37] synthetase (radical SAM superfamily)
MMREQEVSIVFGPVPSRRLGRSLGVNNIPPKICSYSCIYCQIGRTRRFGNRLMEYYEPEKIFDEVRNKVAETGKRGEKIDFIAFVPDGEPTLDTYLGRTIGLLKSLGIKIGVITNSSLSWHLDVRKALREADWVSFKVDSTVEQTWRRVNRPHKSLQLSAILDGILEFKNSYRGTLVTETMLVRGVNDGEENLSSIASFLGSLKPSKSYLSIPIRPPAERSVLPPDEETIARAYRIIGRQVNRVECLIGYEGNAFASTGDPAKDLLSITAVHPMREDAVRELLRKANSDWSVTRSLIDKGLMVETNYEGQRFYVRKFPAGDKVAGE